MELKQLRALLAVAETGSVTRASDILHIVQPAISRQIKLLEEELGAPLFDRERHGMVMTPAGHRFAERARRALKEIDLGKEEISPKSHSIAGSVVVGFLPSAADAMVSSLMGRIRQTYPHIQIRSYISFIADLEQSLERGDVDVALLYVKNGSHVRFPSEALLEESLYLIGPPDAALDMQVPLPLAHIHDLPMVLAPFPHGVRALVERECGAAGVKLNIAAETNSMHLQKNLVAKGVGLSILSSFVVTDDVARGVLTACPVSGADLKRTLHVARAAGKEPSLAAEKVLEELRDNVRQFVAAGGWPGAVLL